MTTALIDQLVGMAGIQFMATGKLKANSGLSSWTVSEMGLFYEEHRSDLVSHATRILKDSSRSEEVVQDALVRFMLAAPDLDSRNEARAYLFKTIENICLDIFRLEGRRPKLVLLDEEVSHVDSVWQSNGEHSETIAAADDAAIVRQALAMLSPAERTALVMWEMEGRSTEEIAQHLGIKESSVRHTVSRARASLRKVLTDWIIDEDRGLTALDLLSTTYKKASDIAKKSSKVALSITLLLFAYLGFTNVSDVPNSISSLKTESKQSISSTTSQVKTSTSPNNGIKVSSNAKLVKPQATKVVNAKATSLNFPGLDKNGVPTGFTITDNTNAQGSLFFVGRETAINDAGITLSSIAKTSKGAANILLNQTLVQDSSGISYDVILSFGRAGAWIPTFTQVISVESERLVSGNYLVTALVQVKSEVETTIVIPASADGRDLEVPPARVVTRILLNPSKTQVLAQAVQVIEKASK